MLLKLILALVCFAAGRYIMHSDQPDLVALRAEILALSVASVGSEMQHAPEDTRSNLQRLKARNSDIAPPCIVSPCQGLTLHDQADRISRHYPEMVDPQAVLKPSFQSAAPQE